MYRDVELNEKDWKCVALSMATLIQLLLLKLSIDALLFIVVKGRQRVEQMDIGSNGQLDRSMFDWCA